MKKQIQAYVLSLMGSAHYSGHTKTMYITDPYGYIGMDIASLVERKFGKENIPFTLKTN